MSRTEDRRPPKPATSVVAAQRARRLAKLDRWVPRSIVVETLEGFVNVVVGRYLVPAVRSSPYVEAAPATQ